MTVESVESEHESVESEHDFLVASNLPVECILGMDFLTKYHAVIDCGERALRLTGADHKLSTQTSDVKESGMGSYIT